mgnify:CR=1 FL=1
MPDAPTSCTEKVFRLYIFNKKAIFSRAKWCIMIQNMGVCVHFGTPRRQRGRNGVSGTFPLPEQPPPALAPHPQLVDKRRMTF